MLYELRIKPEQYKQVKRFTDGKKSYSLFTLIDGDDVKDGVGVMVHGYAEGGVCFKGEKMSILEMAEHIINAYRIKERGIKEIYVLSCFNGLQEEGYVGSIHVYPMFNWVKSEIYSSVNIDMEDNVIVSVSVPELN